MPDEAAAQDVPSTGGAAGSTYRDAWIMQRLPEERARADVVSAAALREGRPGYAQEFRCRGVDGEVRWLLEDVRINSLAPSRWYLVGVCTDITEHKQAEAALQRAKEAAETTNPCQERVPGQRESRNSHPHERRPRA